MRGKFTYTNSESETTNKATGETTSSASSRFKQRYNLDFSKSLYPYLTLVGGTSYDLENATSTSQGTETESEKKILRPFAKLNLNNPLYKAGLGYKRIQIENKTTGTPTTQDFRDEINTILAWKPVGLPEVGLRYKYTHTYDDPETVDSVDKQLAFDSRYTIGSELGLSYFYTATARENNIKNSETLDQNHIGKIDHSHTFFNRRLSLSTAYRIHYNIFKFQTTGTVESALLRNAGYSLIPDNAPGEGALDLNPALINGNVTASAGIDIGLGGDETTLTSIGLDFGFAVNVNKIHLWVHKPLSTLVARSYSWSIYTSPDNSTWTPVATVSTAPFGSVDNRFVISFTEVNTQYIKVVTNPLSPAVSTEKEYTHIYVTEMQAFTTVSGVLIDNKATSVDHNYNLNLRGKISDKAVLGYNLFYKLREQDPSSKKRTELSNGVNLSYIFNRVFSAGTSFTRTDRMQTDQKSTSDNYAASLRAAYLETLEQTLSYSGSKTTEEDGSSSTNSIFLRTNATLYRGWSAFLDAGYSWRQPSESAQTTSTIIGSGTNLVPNDKITINMDYQVTKTQQSDGGGETSSSRWDTQAFITPFRALSFNARVRMLDQGNSTTTLYNYSANWSPFPDGDLQFFFAYFETLRPEDEQKSRTIAPSLKWALGRHFSLDMSYSLNESETKSQATESNSFSASLRVIF